MSESLHIPSGWKESPLVEVVDPHRRITYGIVQPGPRFEPDRGVPMIRGQDYSSGTVEEDDLYHVSPRLAASFERAKVVGGDLLLSIVGYVGLVAEVPASLSGANLTQTTARLAIFREYDSRFFFHFMKSKFFRSEVKKYMKGSAQPGLNLADVEKMKVIFPEVREEQAIIARVLDTPDTAICETEAIIAKLKAVKQGLLHDLLTRGIDANGELRPPQSHAPHLYKQSPLGWIPKEWDFGSIVRYLDSESGIKPGPFGSSIKKDSYSEFGFKVYGQEQVIGGDQELGNYFLPRRKYQELQDFTVEVGDVLISLVGTIGKVLVLKSPLTPGLINPRLMRLRPNKRFAHPEFVGFLVASDFFARQVVVHAGGGTMPVINKRIVSGIQVAVVPLGEQLEILKRKSSIDQRISLEALKVVKLKKEKVGLMDDLLTGRVRVTPLLNKTENPESGRSL
jgi:type I restriction enzyme, S subunit